MSKFNFTSADVFNWYKLRNFDIDDCISQVGYAQFIREGHMSLLIKRPINLCARFFDVDALKQINLRESRSQESQNHIIHSALHNEFCDEIIPYLRENSIVGVITDELFSESAMRNAFRYNIGFSDAAMKLRYEKELIRLDELAALRRENEALRAENEELKLRPPELGGPLYEEAKARFDTMKK